MPIVTMDTKDRRQRQRKNSLRLDNSCVHSRNSAQVVFNNFAMVVLDLLSTAPVETEFLSGRWQLSALLSNVTLGGGGGTNFLLLLCW